MKAFASLFAAGILGLSCALSLSSCAVVVIGAAVGTAVYLEGELKSHLNCDIRKAVDAVNETAEDLGFRPVSRTGDSAGALYIGIDRMGRKVKIKLTPDALNTKVVEIKIRVGGAGNEEDSRRILMAIEKNL